MMYLRIDVIEQAIREIMRDDLGYRVAYALAEDNLRIGQTVVVDCVNPLQVTRDAWLEVAKRARVRSVEVELRCSDLNEHRRRVETRTTDIAGLKMPSWPEVVAREYERWDRPHLILETAGQTVDQNIKAIHEALSAG